MMEGLRTVSRKLKLLFFVIKLNLVFWLLLVNSIAARGGQWWRGTVEVDAALIVAGFVFALVFSTLGLLFGSSRICGDH